MEETKNNYILCIETATEVCSVAISQSGICLAVKSINEQGIHGTQLTPMIESILKENNLTMKDLSAVAYSSGPGSYTGLRIGLSVAKGICFGNEIPLLSIPTLQHLSNMNSHAGSLSFPMIDARRMEVYAALVDDSNNFIMNPFACILDEYNWNNLPSDKSIYCIGNANKKAKEILSIYPHFQFIDTPISASTMCNIAEKKWDTGSFADTAYEVPFYLKEANVSPSKKKLL